MRTSPLIERYELRIGRILNEIHELEKLIENQDGIRTFCKSNPDKVLGAVLKLQNAQINLHEAIDLLLQAGNKTQK